ncbi:hypothetical protein D3C80_1208890 [compost metagenome]
MSIEALVSSQIARMVAPPLPITSRILSVSIFIAIMVGALADSSVRDWPMIWFIWPRMFRRASRAWPRAISMISSVMPLILMSICSAVTPLAVPATLKSMSPRWSSSPRMSVRTANFSPSLTRPMAIPATGAFIGTPASIRAREAPQTEAIELEPLDSVISDTTRMVYGNTSAAGSMAETERRARRP